MQNYKAEGVVGSLVGAAFSGKRDGEMWQTTRQPEAGLGQP